MVEGAGRIFFQQEAPVGRYAEREGRARRAGRHRPDKKVLPFLCKKKTARQKPGDRHQGAGSRAGQAVRDWKERFWKGEGECEGERETFSGKRFSLPPIPPPFQNLLFLSLIHI